MISTLHINNYALIDSLDIEFGGGFNIITGETGAGKSIILGALGLLLGGRADSRVIRDASRKSVIEAEFLLDEDTHRGIQPVLAEAEVDDDARSCILRRELSPSGRSRAFVNDTPVNLTVLRDVAVRLVDIHSQHQNLLLADASYRLSIIDCLAANRPLLEEYRAAYREYRKILQKYTETRELIRRNRADADFIAYQLEELKEMELRNGEQGELERERELQANASSIKTHLEAALAALAENESNVIDLVDDAAYNCRSMGDMVEEADSLSERLDSVAIEVKDIADTLRRRRDGLQADPERLAAVEERLSRLYSLELKHHVDTADGLIAVRDRLAEQLEAISNSDDVLAALEARAKDGKRLAMSLAQRLSQGRAETAEAFAAELRRRAVPLGMANLRCEVAISKGKLGPDGIDTVDFLFAFNKNQALSSVADTASGGEISRLMLCVKSIVAERMRLPSIIFDEIDTGVSGDIANRIGAMMAQIAATIQVIAITHLPQVASRGETHYKVYKEDDETSTSTRIRPLGFEARVGEIALMLSGDPADPTAIEAAKTLLRKGAETVPAK